MPTSNSEASTTKDPATAPFLVILDEFAYEYVETSAHAPQLWNRENDADVSAKLDAMQVDIDRKPRPVWEVVKVLFEAGELDLARKAQRFVVPALS